MNSPPSRRAFLKQMSAAAAGLATAATLPQPLLVRLGRAWEPAPPIQDPRLKDLASRALESASAAGATYADVRLTHTRVRNFDPNHAGDSEVLGAGVRSLVNGYWGFASGPVWSPDEMGRLGTEAVHQARTNSLGASRAVDLAPAPAVQDGHWTMPVERDPFEISPFEIQDFLSSLNIFTARTPRAGVGNNFATFTVQEKAFASSAGTYCTQRRYLSQGVLTVVWSTPRGERYEWTVLAINPAGLGFELWTADRIPRVRDHPLREEIRHVIDAMEVDSKLPVKPVDVGRYDAVFDPASMHAVVAGTIGAATELDRALGYEANADGTSYITDPFGSLGTAQLGATTLTLTADRSTQGGAATVQWDDEGVTPDQFTLVNGGILNDFQTTRESAGWLKESYARLGRPWRSHGCANAPSAIEPAIQHAPNLVMTPGAEALDFDALVSGVSEGLAIERATASMDFQAATGLGRGLIYKIEHGKKVARLAGAGFLFRATEFWKSLHLVGGDVALRRYGLHTSKGEPAQGCYYSMTAPPAAVRQLALIDVLRKA